MMDVNRSKPTMCVDYTKDAGDEDRAFRDYGQDPHHVASQFLGINAVHMDKSRQLVPIGSRNESRTAITLPNGLSRSGLKMYATICETFVPGLPLAHSKLAGLYDDRDPRPCENRWHPLFCDQLTTLLDRYSGVIAAAAASACIQVYTNKEFDSQSLAKKMHTSLISNTPQCWSITEKMLESTLISVAQQQTGTKLDQAVLQLLMATTLEGYKSYLLHLPGPLIEMVHWGFLHRIRPDICYNLVHGYPELIVQFKQYTLESITKSARKSGFSRTVTSMFIQRARATLDPQPNTTSTSQLECIDLCSSSDSDDSSEKVKVFAAVRCKVCSYTIKRGSWAIDTAYGPIHISCNK